MKLLIFVFISFIYFNIVTSKNYLEAEKLIKFIADNAQDNQVNAKLLNYNQGARQGSFQEGYGGDNQQKSLFLARQKKLKGGKKSTVLVQTAPVQPSSVSYGTQQQQQQQQPNVVSYGSVQPQQPTVFSKSVVLQQQPSDFSYGVAQPQQPVVFSKSVVQQQQPSYGATQRQQSVSSFGVSQISSMSQGGYGSERQATLPSTLQTVTTSIIPNPVCQLNFINLNDQQVQPYCICPDSSYGFTCTENFGNPCLQFPESQFYPAHPSLGPQYFVHCDWNTPKLKICAPNTVWNQQLLTCSWSR